MASRSTDAQRPWWHQAVEGVDRCIGPALEAAVRHEAFVVGYALVRRGRRGVGSRVERFSRQILHSLNLPAASDVNRLLNQIGAVQHGVRVLSNKIDDRLPVTNGEFPAVDPTS